MKVLIFLTRFPTLSETFILNQITGLIDASVDVKIFSYYKSLDDKVHPEVFKYDLLKRTRYILPTNKLVRLIKALLLIPVALFVNPKVLRSLFSHTKSRFRPNLRLFLTTWAFQGSDFDVIHCHYGHTGLNAVYAKEVLRLNAKMLVSFHGTDVNYYMNKHGNDCYSDLFEKADLISVVCDKMKKNLAANGYLPEKMIIHYSGTDTELFRPAGHRAADPRIRLITIARLIEIKGVLLTLQIFQQLIRQQGLPDIEFNIIGHGPLYDELNDFVLSNELDKRVFLKGAMSQADVITYLHNSDICILNSTTQKAGDEEGIPGALREAMSCGLPVVATLHGGIPELVEHNASGYLVNENSGDELLEKIIHLVKHPELRIKFGNRGREIIENKFNINLLNQKLLGIYESMLS